MRPPPVLRMAAAAVAAGILLRSRRDRGVGGGATRAAAAAAAAATAAAAAAAAAATPVLCKPDEAAAVQPPSWQAALASLVASASAFAEWAAGLRTLADARADAQPLVQREAVQGFCGVWLKAGGAPIADAFYELFAVPRWLRRATRLMYGMEISLSPDGQQLLIKQLCRLSWLSITESFLLDGSSALQRQRRDMRPGKQQGELLAASSGVMRCRVTFQGGLAGEATDVLRLAAPDELIVEHVAHVHGRGSASFTETFKRAPAR